MSTNSPQDAAKQVQEYHEQHMSGGQHLYFRLIEGQLHLQPTHRLWMEAHQQKALHLLDVQPDDCFVDIGCGEGYLTLPLAARAWRSVGLDLAISGLRVIQAQTAYQPDRPPLIVSEADHLPLTTGCADKLLCNHVLEHVLDDDAILQEMWRVVKPGGLILIGVPLTFAPQTKALLWLRRRLRPNARQLQLEKITPGQLVEELIGVQSHIRFYDLAALRHLLARNDFAVVRAEGIGLSWRQEKVRHWIRRHQVPFSFFLWLGKWFPSIGDGVFVLARRV
jgi:ubiquinone/menaquinone biosynthesis C-methylase UbiE